MNVTLNKNGTKEKYKIQNWNSLTLEKWAEMMAIKNKSNVKEAIENIKVLSDIPRKLIEQLSIKDAAFILEKATEVQKEGKLKDKITIHGVKYGFMPNLEAITLGEYADIEQYVANGLESNMNNIMAVLYRPIIEEKKDNYTITAYDGDKVEVRAEVFKKMKAKDVNQALLFFWTLGSELLTILPKFLENLQKKMDKQISLHLPKQILEKNGVGSE
tara:strand:- start:452 stop:1099 length:648 start_codon:yes stop_codon:yes gene_type:complete